MVSNVFAVRAMSSSVTILFADLIRVSQRHTEKTFAARFLCAGPIPTPVTWEARWPRLLETPRLWFDSQTGIEFGG
jgi:hypothetical protein